MYDDAPVGRAAVLKSASDPALATKMAPIARPVLKAGDNPQEVLWGHLLVVVDGAGATDLGRLRAVDHIGRRAAGRATSAALGLPPATTEALASSAVAGNAFVSQFTERVTVDAKPSPLWQYLQYAQMEAAIAEEVQAVLIGSSKPKDAMAAAGKKVQALAG